MAFDNSALVRDIDSSRLETAYSRTIEIKVSDATIIGPGGGTAKSLVINAGAVRFGQDGDNHGLEDGRNEDSQDAEIDGATGRRTVTLNLRLHYVTNGRDVINGGALIGAASFAAFGNVGLTSQTNYLGDTTFGAAVDNAKTDLTDPVLPQGNPTKDLWFFTDASAERTGDDIFCQINRLAYQSWALLKAPGDQ